MRSFVLGIFLLPFTLLCGESEIYVGVQHFYTTLKFNHRPELKGCQYGVIGGYAFYQNCYFADLSIEADWSPNHLDGNHWTKSRVREQIARLKVGYFSHSCDCFSWKAYLGLGFNWLHNRDIISYEYRKAFMPIGFLASWQATPCLKMGFQLEWRPDIHAYLNTVSKSLNINRKDGYRLEFPFLIDLCGSPCMGLAIVPIVDVNRFGSYSKKNTRHVYFPIYSATRRDFGLRVTLHNNF